jgi:16S rRNA (uracil1498-N3)-methyltransferase
VPKGDRAEQLLQQCSEIGVDRLSWLHFERSVTDVREAKYAKWARHAVESAKQCGRPHLLAVDPERAFPAELDTLLANPDTALFCCDPSATRSVHDAADDMRVGTGPKQLVALIGPEGGWAPTEVELLQRAAQRAPDRVATVRLADNVLRVETAAVTAAVLLGALAQRAVGPRVWQTVAADV